MRSFISKAVTGTMIAGAALMVSACAKTETTNTVVDVTNTETVNDTMTGTDATMSNDTVVANDTGNTM